MTATQIAIDGPAGAGKSTVARLVAKRLGYLYVDTGAMYRAVALAALLRGISVDDSESLTELAQRLHISLKHFDGNYHIYCDGEDVTEAIRGVKVGDAASPISAIAGVREALVAQQRNMSAHNNVVMDGRDIGTVVLPQAQCKIFLTASLEERARRRTQELRAKGIYTVQEKVAADIKARDHRDSSRSHSPLKQAEDAILLDSSDLTIEQVVDKILQLAGR